MLSSWFKLKFYWEKQQQDWILRLILELCIPTQVSTSWHSKTLRRPFYCRLTFRDHPPQVPLRPSQRPRLSTTCATLTLTGFIATHQKRQTTFIDWRTRQKWTNISILIEYLRPLEWMARKMPSIRIMILKWMVILMTIRPHCPLGEDQLRPQLPMAAPLQIMELSHSFHFTSSLDVQWNLIVSKKESNCSFLYFAHDTT